MFTTAECLHFYIQEFVSNSELLVFYSEQRHIIQHGFCSKSTENFEPRNPVGKYRLKCLPNTVTVSPGQCKDYRSRMVSY